MMLIIDNSMYTPFVLFIDHVSCNCLQTLGVSVLHENTEIPQGTEMSCPAKLNCAFECFFTAVESLVLQDVCLHYLALATCDSS